MSNKCDVCEEMPKKEDPAYQIRSMKKGVDFPNVDLVLCVECWVKFRTWCYDNFGWKNDKGRKLKRANKL